MRVGIISKRVGLFYYYCIFRLCTANVSTNFNSMARSERSKL
jgi:hypothetical protein